MWQISRETGSLCELACMHCGGFGLVADKKFFAVITQWSRGLIFCTCRPIGNNNKYEGLALCNPIKSCKIVPLRVQCNVITRLGRELSEKNCSQPRIDFFQFRNILYIPYI